MKKIVVKNTYDIGVLGKPDTQITQTERPKEVAVSPSSIPYIKPKLIVKTGDEVKAGQVLFFDKQNERIQFVSPVSGKVSEVVFGARRAIDAVKIAVDDEDVFVQGEQYTADSVQQASRETIVDRLVDGGVWNFLREYPFKRIPDPSVEPPAIYVSLDNDEPFQPDFSVLLQEYKEELVLGLEALKVISGGNLFVGVSSRYASLVSGITNVTHEISGGYPANNPGVFLYHHKTSPEQNESWGIYGQAVMMIGRLLKTGCYPSTRIYALGGDLHREPKHVMAYEGSGISSFMEFVPGEPARYIGGGILTGRNMGRDGFLGFDDFALNMIREGKAPEMLTFFRPGIDKPTFSRTYLSALFKRAAYKMTTSLNGGDRSCISCGDCKQVCPNDLHPDLLMKSVLAGDIEEMMEMGLLDCVDCGLCTYVCPSKIGMDSIFQKATARLEKETR